MLFIPGKRPQRGWRSRARVLYAFIGACQGSHTSCLCACGMALAGGAKRRAFTDAGAEGTATAVAGDTEAEDRAFSPALRLLDQFQRYRGFALLHLGQDAVE